MRATVMDAAGVALMALHFVTATVVIVGFAGTIPIAAAAERLGRPVKARAAR